MQRKRVRIAWRLCSVWLALALWVAGPAWSSQVTIDQSTVKLDLRDETSWFLDEQADQSATSMFERVDAGDFLPPPAHGPLFGFHDGAFRPEERRVGQECAVRVNIGGRRSFKKKKTQTTTTRKM